MSLLTTGSQTIGPYLHIGTDWLNTPNLVGDKVTGTPITIEGRMIDGNGAPVGDGLVEIWQANAHGKLAHSEDQRDLPTEPGFRGWGRVPTDENGRFQFTTVKPGRVPSPVPGAALQAAHIAVTIFGRGLTKQLVSRIYFPDGEGHAEDFVLKQVPEQRRATLVARAIAGRPNAYEWNIVLQGDASGQGETVFFDF
ncbi:protocatechuate 3,4-dioxygenase subunit alpha [Lacisediminimonas profundi]|uniref:protocatechuate 3,4-dioxygenase subunit alpha n=1 Tax=Lacisediminimonas profundi TaxID=2603856 RepID=UPI00124B7FB2|nr:protocatechuate 3,4-dioxygenase subunit alpha [Lacisediminimonas profundi]